ncbi:S1 family peptidase [Phytoactinopolyspora limicola]|uniref:S1 family peptidase n=1 Tax=Phytoactinopolyspora limicola TaxID=2715536 RepID=UPI00140DE4BD|nr:S1 family peptidase [Phytoactinopolyspora limicola]
MLATAAGTAMLATLLLPSGAQADPDPSSAPLVPPDGTSAEHLTATTLVTTLGDDRTGGIYENSDGEIVVTVTDKATSAAVSAAGAIPEVVAYSTAELNAIHAGLDELPVIGGTAWGTNVPDNQLVVSVDGTVSDTDLAKIKAATAPHGDAVRIERIAGEIQIMTSIVGGMGISDRDAPGAYCSLGFNVQDNNGRKWGLTAGHCTRYTHLWNRRANGVYIGWSSGSQYPGRDFGRIRYTDSTRPLGTVWVNGAEQQITNSRNPRVNEKVKRVGTVSSDLIGKVIATGVTTNAYDPNLGENVRLTNMTYTTLCSKSGDSGGPLFTGTTALGLLSAGNTPRAAKCNSAVSDYRTWFQPVQPALNYYGLKVY